MTILYETIRFFCLFFACFFKYTVNPHNFNSGLRLATVQEPYLGTVFNAIFWRIHSMYVGGDYSKMLSKGFVNYSQIRNLFSIKNGVSIPRHLYMGLVHERIVKHYIQVTVS